MRECTRRTFIQVAVGAAVCAVVGAVGNVPLDGNYERSRQRLRAIAEEGAVIAWWALAAPRDGSRSALVFVEGRREPLRFEQPWEGDCI
jgi:hypothetical protein